MDEFLLNCDKLYKTNHCCHIQPHTCNCYECIKPGFYTEPDLYNCLKKICFYSMNYGPIFSSEIYHYFNVSKILDEFCNNTISILSLGCGFSPEIYAVDKYLSENELNISYNYTGIDIEELWNQIRIKKSNLNYITKDILQGFSFSEFDLILLNNVYSTILRHNLIVDFRKILVEEINSNLKASSVLIYIDINEQSQGRVDFCQNIKPLFNQKKSFYFPIDRAYTGNYTKISKINNVFIVPELLSISPLNQVRKTVIFELRK